MIRNDAKTLVKLVDSQRIVTLLGEFEIKQMIPDDSIQIVLLVLFSINTSINESKNSDQESSRERERERVQEREREFKREIKRERSTNFLETDEKLCDGPVEIVERFVEKELKRGGRSKGKIRKKEGKSFVGMRNTIRRMTPKFVDDAQNINPRRINKEVENSWEKVS